MNREILFRGQHRRKGEKVRLDGTPVESKWVYGGVCQYNGKSAIIYQTEPEISKFPVYADTLGQYTGLTDKNGVKIFEGDIIKTKKYGKIVGHANVNDFDVFEVVYTPCQFRLEKKNRGFNLVDDGYSDFEIIGNIHDVICMKRTKLEKGKVYLTQEDANCRNYYEPIGGETNG